VTGNIFIEIIGVSDKPIHRRTQISVFALAPLAPLRL
jgi:hypothetical protein